MRTVWKFEVEVTDEPVVKVPDGAEFLSHVHAATPALLWLWAKVDTNAPLVPRTLYIRGTGHPHFDEVGPHIGSVVTADGALVWHVFDEVQR